MLKFCPGSFTSCVVAALLSLAARTPQGQACVWCPAQRFPFMCVFMAGGIHCTAKDTQGEGCPREKAEEEHPGGFHPVLLIT